MTRPEKWNWLHRDAEGRGLVVGPNCPDCLRAVTAAYRCTACDAVWDVPGVLRWSWQGKSHYHDPDDMTWYQTVGDHVNSHVGPAFIIPRSAVSDGSGS